jgi:hypothetical protein
MALGPAKWIRSIEDAPAGKVVPGPTGNIWEWDAPQGDETARLLKRLESQGLAIEQTDVKPVLAARRPAAGIPPRRERGSSR